MSGFHATQTPDINNDATLLYFFPGHCQAGLIGMWGVSQN